MLHEVTVQFGCRKMENGEVFSLNNIAEVAPNEAALATTSTKAVNTCTQSRKSAAFFYSTLSKCPSKEH